MPVFTPVAEYIRLGTKVWSGQLASTVGAITAGTVKFKNAVTVVWNSTGLFTFSMWVDNAHLIPWKPKRFADLNLTFITPPGGATEGGWSWTLNTTLANVATTGVFQVRIAQQSFAVADPVQTWGAYWVTEDEVA
jgi:hypothetical protein